MKTLILFMLFAIVFLAVVAILEHNKSLTIEYECNAFWLNQSLKSMAPEKITMQLIIANITPIIDDTEIANSIDKNKP